MNDIRTKKCDECLRCVLLDFGYSNYTVEGTYVICSEGIHPDGVFDRWYGEDKRLNFAEQCEMFMAGKPLEMDCEQEGLSELTPKDRATWDRAMIIYAKAPGV